MRKFGSWSIVLLVLAGIVAGCSGGTHKVTAESSSQRAETSKVSTSSKSESKPLFIGQIYSTKKANPNIAYKMANKHVKFYRSLKAIGAKDGEFANYYSEKGESFGITKVVTATRGVYYHVVSYTVDEGRGFGKGKPDDLGYVKATDMKRVSLIKSEWSYTKKKPYYVADPNSHRIWNRPVYTRPFTRVTHVFDRLTSQQLYATKELITSKGKHYVYLETAKGRKLGWVYKARHTLIAGKYRDPGKQLLKLKKHEKMVTRIQSKKSTPNRVGVNDSLSLQQRVYIVRNKRHQIARILIISMDNRPTKIYFHNGRGVKVKTYTYRRKPWKVTTNKKKLRTVYWAEHEYDKYMSSDSIRSKFYSLRSKKLVKVNTAALDGYAYVLIYRNGEVKFASGVFKHNITYSINEYK